MNRIKNAYRYTVSDRLGVLQQQPLGESDFKVSWERQDENNISYKKQGDGQLTFTGDAYNNLLSLEQSSFRCEYILITVERRCVDDVETFIPLFSGRISLNDGAWNLDKCFVKIKVQSIQPQQCLDDNKGKEIDLMQTIPGRRRVNTLPAALVVEKKEFMFDGVSFGDCFLPMWGDPGTPADGRWVLYYQKVFKLGIICVTISRWARYKVSLTCADASPGDEWMILSESCPGSRVYVKEANLYDCTDTNPDGATTEHSCKIVADGTNGAIDNGLDFENVLMQFVSTFCPSLTIVSDFFQINPEHTSSDNYVTGLESTTNKIVVFQKSDVKRPNAFENATKAVWTWEKCINAICETFNCRWVVDGDTLRIEHVSFFNVVPGIDLTVDQYTRYMVGKREYSYATEKIPQREDYKFMEASDGDFKGVPIVYSGACVSQEGQQNVTTHTVDDVTTDVELCFANADGDSSIVDDHGFVFISCKIVSGNYIIRSEDPILDSIKKLNNPFSWAHLHRDFHKYYRPLQFGNMNNEDVEFLSVKPTKKGVTITFPLCCGDTFNPGDTIKTFLGDGIVDKATYSLRDGLIAVDLLYPVADLIVNEPPVAVNDTVEVVKNIAEDIDVLANDSDPESDEIVAVEIVGVPSHGTSTITIDKKIHYTPALNYVGADLLTYRIKDSWSNWSNTALVTIDVVPPALSLEIVNDEYSTEINTPLSESAGSGLLSNDTTSAGPLTCTPETKATAEGGTVQIFADGSFDYTPAIDFVGEDSFTYTASNGTDTDSGNATILVTQPEHLQSSNYTPDDVIILDWCSLDNFRFCRTTDATTAATAAGERVEVTARFTANNGCDPFEESFIFEPTDTCSVPHTRNDCDFEPGCSSFAILILSIVVIP